jgi:hypothetical protein
MLNEYHAHGNLLILVPIDCTLAAESEEAMRDLIKKIILQSVGIGPNYKPIVIEDQVSILLTKKLLPKENK